MPFPKEGGEEELGVTIHIYEYYRWLPSLRSVGFNVPSPESPNDGLTLRGFYALKPSGSLRNDTLHYDTLPLCPPFGF